MLRNVKLQWLDDRDDTAVALVDSAAWNCCCPQKSLLLGSLKIQSGEVSCPSCERRYRVVADGTRAGSVQELLRSPWALEMEKLYGRTLGPLLDELARAVEEQCPTVRCLELHGDWKQSYMKAGEIRFTGPRGPQVYVQAPITRSGSNRQRGDWRIGRQKTAEWKPRETAVDAICARFR